jgi:predicted amidohydrolase YtcJ
MGWDQTNWPGGEFPTAVCAYATKLLFHSPPAMKDDLDREPLLRGRPVLLVRVDGHAYWVSNAILSNLRNLPDAIDGGLIIRDGNGKPTGRSDSLV